VIPFAEHRPETVSEAVWLEYVQIMAAAGQGKVRPPDHARLLAIYDQAPEIVVAGRSLDFSPRCSR
jgi:hypothetical protein